MFKLVFSILLTGLLLFCFSQNKFGYDKASHLRTYQSAENIFRQAEYLSSQAGDDENKLATADKVYKQALVKFDELLFILEKEGSDSLALHTRLRAGLISFYINQGEEAKINWLAAIELKKRYSTIPDSILFIPSLYTGTIYYDQHQYDSALYYYKKAEAIQGSYPKPLAESERLYDRLAVILAETGYYRQARNYFEKAITLTHPSNKNLLANYKTNSASLLVKLEEYNLAKTSYETLLDNGFFENEIHHNLAIISLHLHDPVNAIAHLRKVDYRDNKKNIDLYYNYAMAYADLHEVDSSSFYFQKALAENLKWNGTKKNVQLGLLLKFKGDELAGSKKYKDAINRYQEAIQQFDTRFNDEDIYANPEDFTAVISYINLFNTLSAKADVLDKSYTTENELDLLKASLDGYHAAFKLADYVERTYDSDEARLFLTKIKQSAYSRPIEVTLRLYSLTREKKWLEETYYFDQLNKASALTLNALENEQRVPSHENEELYRKESALRSRITHMSLKMGGPHDSNTLQSIYSKIREDELELGRIQEKINKNSGTGDRLIKDHIPSVKEVQKKLDNKTAIISWHLSENELLAIVITGNRFSYQLTTIGEDFFNKIDSLNSILHTTNSTERYSGESLSHSLYDQLIAPISSKLNNMERLIIIPDEELNYLPVEALQDENKHWLIEKYSVQYQFSTGLLFKESKKNAARGILALAPFNECDYADNAGSPNGYKLYVQKVYNMHLDSTELIILSACETGIKRAGLMSLSRAFAYAGCPNLITSLWKAENKTTSFLNQRLDYYLRKGWSKDKSLQEAKKDLLDDKDLDPGLKSPHYWSRLIFIGAYESRQSSYPWWWIAAGLLFGSFVYLIFNKKEGSQ